MDAALKHCPKCDPPKDRSDFYADPGAPDGLLSRCKECHKAAVKARYRVVNEERAAYERRRFKARDERQVSQRLREERDRAQRQLSAARGRVTRIKNRVANGVCPCCGRTFVALARHMATKHPDFTAQEVG